MTKQSSKRALASRATAESLRKEAKQWYKALRRGDPAARERLERILPNPGTGIGLRDVQRALALEYGVDGWAALKQQLADLALARRSAAERADDFLRHAIDRQNLALAAHILDRHPEIARFSLHTAVVCGDLAEVERRLAVDTAAGSAVGGPRNWQPLQYLCYARLPAAAASDNAVAIARALLDAGADPRATWTDDWDNPFTLLTGVIGDGEGREPPHPRAVELAELLIERGAEPFDTQSLYNTSLNTDDAFWLEFLYARSESAGTRDRWSSKEAFGESGMLDYLLGNAVSRNYLHRSRWLLAHGARATARHAYSKRNLHTEALLGGFTELARLLTEFGARPEPLNDLQAAQAACMSGDHETVLRLLAAHPEYVRHPGPMYQAADADRADVVEFLLQHGMSPDLAHGGWTALHACAHNGSVRVAKVLIERGASIDIRENKYHATPLGHANWAGQSGMVELLGEVSRDVFSLVRAGKLERLRTLLDEDPKLATALHDGRNALFFLSAPEERAIEIAELLLARGADAGLTDKDGMTAAELAIQQGLEDVAEVLRSA